MGNLSTSWLIIWAQVIYILGANELMCKVIKVKNQGPKLQTFICFHSFILGIILFFIFAYSLKLNFKSQTAMGEHKHKILVTFVFSMAIFQVEKIETPFIIHKQAYKPNKRRGKWGKIKCKGRRKYRVWFGAYFDHKMWIHQNNYFYYNNIGPKGCKLAPQGDRYPFFALGPCQGHKMVD